MTLDSALIYSSVCSMKETVQGYFISYIRDKKIHMYAIYYREIRQQLS